MRDRLFGLVAPDTDGLVTADQVIIIITTINIGMLTLIIIITINIVLLRW